MHVRSLAIALSLTVPLGGCGPGEAAHAERPRVAPAQSDPPGAVLRGSDGPVCGRLAAQPIVQKTDPFLPTQPECNRAATIWENVAHEDRSCRVDADCVALGGGAGGCFAAALNRAGASRSEYQSRPCGNPAAGACAARALEAYCADGCCAVR